MMKLILQEDVPHLGVVGDLVSVKDGYGRNFLIPQGKAVHASPKSVRELEHQKRLAAKLREKATAEASEDKDKIEGLSIAIQAKVAPPTLNDKGEREDDELQKLFGSITNRDIAKVLADAGIKVDHRKVTLSDTVRTLGKFEADIRLNGGISANLPFWVIPEGSEDIEAAKKDVEAQQAAAEAKAKAEAEKAAKKAAPVAPIETPAEAEAKVEEEAQGDKPAGAKAEPSAVADVEIEES
jgi:large subunit ribosomal protein L9